jgi:hypothetical protein
MVTMATELFCLNKLLENLRYFHVVFLSVDLRVTAIPLWRISTYIETRFDNTVQCDPMIHFIANFYRFYCLLVFYLIAK